MTTTDRRARERQVHVSVVLAATLAWSGSAAVVLHEMRREEAAREEAAREEAAREEALLRQAREEALVATATGAETRDPTSRTLSAAGLRPAPPPRRRVVVVRRSRAS